MKNKMFPGIVNYKIIMKLVSIVSILPQDRNRDKVVTYYMLASKVHRELNADSPV